MKEDRHWLLKKLLPLGIVSLAFMIALPVMDYLNLSPAKKNAIWILSMAGVMIAWRLFSYFVNTVPVPSRVHIDEPEEMPIQTWTATEIATVRERLQQVIGWTNRLAANASNHDTKSIFRHTNPDVNGIIAFDLEGAYPAWKLDDQALSTYKTLMKYALAAREPHATETVQHPLEHGGIMVYAIGNAFYNEPLTAESKGFIDTSFAPPIDTWIYLKSDDHGRGAILLCWVPAAFTEMMESVVDLDGGSAYQWLWQYDLDLYTALNG